MVTGKSRDGSRFPACAGAEGAYRRSEQKREEGGKGSLKNQGRKGEDAAKGGSSLADEAA